MTVGLWSNNLTSLIYTMETMIIFPSLVKMSV